eukprot:9759163-Alexandrium_andersonii.AAC.1
MRSRIQEPSRDPGAHRHPSAHARTHTHPLTPDAMQQPPARTRRTPASGAGRPTASGARPRVRREP